MKKILLSVFAVVFAAVCAFSQTTILDFEAPATSTTFQYFGSSLEGTLTSVIANPASGGINTSAMVSNFVKPAGAQFWAGAFSNPNPATAIVTNGSNICIKVRMDHIGSVTLKLEHSTSGQPNWFLTVPNTQIDTWEEICFNTTLPSGEAPNQVAMGTYERAVLFFDFGTPGGGADVTSYFDDMIVTGGSAPVDRTVNFAVDMREYAGSVGTVYLSGSFNNWSGDANPMTDANGDSIWVATLMLPDGPYEYKVTIDNWNVQEAFLGVEECTKTTGPFTNRYIVVAANMSIPQHCFNSCYACGEEVLIDFQLDMHGVPPNPSGIWIAGGAGFGAPGGNYKMLGPDVNGNFALVVPRHTGFSSYYAYANGPCADYSCKENLAGQPCADPNNYNDRWLPAVNANTTVNNCYEFCAPTPAFTQSQQYVCKNQSATFTVADVPGSTYTWTVPATASITSGQGTNSVVVAFSATAVSGVINVASVSSCGDNAAAFSYTVSTTKPGTPPSISGPDVPCGYGIVYTCPVVLKANSYNWTVPATATIVSGQGTNTVTVDFGPTFTSGSIKVSAVNCIGASAFRSKTLYGKPATPGTVSGQITGVCGSTLVYSIAPVLRADSYTWTAPANASIISGQGTASVEVSYDPAFTTGNLTVSAQNACGSSAAKSAAIKSKPGTPGAISGSTSICPNQMGVAYSIAPVPGATTYTWTVPAGASIVSGQGTDAISVNFGAAGGAVKVKAGNACGFSALKSLTVAINCNKPAGSRGAEIEIENEFSIYPNPGQGQFFVSFTAAENAEFKISLTDITGREVYSTTQNAMANFNEHQLSLDYILPGVYMVVFEMNGTRTVEKLVVQ